MSTRIPGGLKNRVEAGKTVRSNGHGANGNGNGAITLNEVFGGLLQGRGNPTMNAMTSRAALLDKMFDSRRDIDTECGYPKMITAAQYRTLYDREGIATRVVSVYPEESWQLDPKIYETEEAGKTPWEATFDQLSDEHNLIHYMQRVDEMSGIGTFGLLLLGIDDGKKLDEPVEGIILDGVHAGRKMGFQETTATGEDNETETVPTDEDESDTGLELDDTDVDAEPELDEEGNEIEPGVEIVISEPVETSRSLIYLRVFDESLVDIAEYDADETSRRYGMPKFYNVKFNDPTAQGSATAAAPDITTKKVHWTRVLHVADNRKSSEVFGTPRMQASFNRLYDLRKLLGGSAEMFWKGAFPGFSFEVNPDLGDVELDPEKMREEFAAYANGLQRYLALTGVSAKSLAVQVASPEDHVMVQIKAIAITVKTPLRIFMGSEAAHLASTQDQETWNGRLLHRQTKYLTPRLIRPLLDHLIAMDVLPEPGPEGFSVEWPDLNTPSDESKAKVAEVVVKAIASYITSGADTLIPPFEFLTMIMGMDPEQAEAIIEAAHTHLEDKEDLELESRERRGDKGLPVPPSAEEIAAQQFENDNTDDDDEDEDEDEDDEKPTGKKPPFAKK